MTKGEENDNRQSDKTNRWKLLHDIGKVVYRSGDGRNHSQSGYEYLKNEADIHDVKILNCVRYHHGVYLKMHVFRKMILHILLIFLIMLQLFRIVERRKIQRTDSIRQCHWKVYLTF